MSEMDHLFTLRVELRKGVRATITAWDAPYVYSHTGHHKIDAELRIHEHGKTTVIFPRGATWCAVNSCTPTDGVDAKRLVLSLFSMKPGDTDSDYFDSYTPEQLGFASSYGEELSMISMYRYGED